MAIFILLSCVLINILFILTVNGRILRLDVSDGLISDGVDAVDTHSPFLDHLDIVSTHKGSCNHIYGFLPCAENLWGYIFQIFVYQYLLIIGGKLISDGSKALFNIFGTGVYGASVFRILTVLPKMVMVIVSGVLTTKQKAQVKVSFGVGVYAGSTVLNLTLLWGMCVIFGRKELFTNSANAGRSVSKSLISRKILSNLKDTGVIIDPKTCYTAGIMLLSLIPYLIVQLPNFVKTTFGTQTLILIALIVSTAFLFSYFLYQIFDPWIQERSLEYSKYENLLAGFLQHVQRHAKGKLIDDNGLPDVHVIKGLFYQTDKDADKCINFGELENLILDITQSGKGQVEKDYAISEILKAFDLNTDGRIEEHEFVDGCTKWINEARQLAENGDPSSSTFLSEVVEPFSKNKRIESAKVEHLMARILKHAQSQSVEAENLVTDDGRPNVERIKALFKQFDTDNSNSLSRSELEQVIQTIKVGASKLNFQEMADELMKDFDKDGDDHINEQEFIHGFTKWLNRAMDVAKCKDAKRSIDEFDKIMWGEVDSLVYEVGQKQDTKLKRLTWSFNKSILQVIIGISILTFLSSPLMNSIQLFSDAIGVPSFFTSFVIVPVAMNARTAILAVFPASQKTSRTSSLTFSEIYGGVIMNNIMGLSTLLAIVYIKDLNWEYSAEVLTILVVCAIIGLMAFSQTAYPLWTCLLAFSLYPFSLVMYYIFHYLLGWD